MMSEAPFRRVVVLCDASCDIRLAVSDAAALAARWGAALHGVFLEDENLHRLAELPFSQQVSLSHPGLSEALSGVEMTRLVSALSAGMRRALAEAAGARGVEWSFDTTRSTLAAASVETEAGDVIVLEGTKRAFSGTWRPHERIETTSAACSGTVLIRGRRTGGSGIVVLLPEQAAGGDKVLAAGAAVAGGSDAVVIAGSPAALADAASSIARSFPSKGAGSVRTLALPADLPAALRAIESLDPAVIVIEPTPDCQPTIDALMERARADVLLVR